MSVRNALLAILTEGTCYGYQLRTEFSRRTGTTVPLNVGQIYNTLDRLERDGLVLKGIVDAVGHVPYTITDRGRDEVTDWLGSSVGGAGARDELLVKVTVALSLPDADAHAVIEAQRASTGSDLTDAVDRRERLQSGGAALAELIAQDAHEAALTARLAWLDVAARRITEARAAGARPAGLAAAPRRGRPVRVAAGPGLSAGARRPF